MNPRPDVAIKSIEVSQGKTKRGNKGTWTTRNNGNFGVAAVTLGQIVK